MFRNRRNSQKPSEDLYTAFRQSFPHVGPGTVTTSAAATTPSAALLSGPLSDPIMDHRHLGDLDDSKRQSSSFRPTIDEWRLTPSLMDTTAFTYGPFSNQAHGYYTPTPGGTGTFYHNKAGDLHTPDMGFHLGTPLSMPNSEGQTHPATAFDMHGFHPHVLQSHGFNVGNHFHPQQSYAPSSFVHQDSGFDTTGLSNDNTPEQSKSTEKALTVSSRILNSDLPVPIVPPNNSFRYQVTLNAPTAMIKHADEIPITYLNKGQAYSISIVDSFGVIPSPGPIKYRTVVRISFEDEQQRQRPAACWQLWKEGRGLAEAHQRGGKLQAVEYVDPNQGGGIEPKRSRVELEMASFDCFSVTWTPAAGGSSADCSVAVRFNFLSTDFSHSKGVKGIPVRLCTKTEIVSSGTPDSPPGPVSEVCFCKVKLFRDHGAERKLSNDVTHIRKTIDKLKQQIAQAESGTKESGKRKRSGSMARTSGNRPGKVQKHKRTWSISSQGSCGRNAPEEDLHFKLATMQDMFTSTRPLSLLYLKGYEDDDPDLYPVALLGQQQDHLKAEGVGKKTPLTQKASEATSPSNSAASPCISSPSMLGQTQSAACAGYRNRTPEHQLQEDWDAFASFTNPGFHATHSQAEQPLAGSSVKIQRSQGGAETSKWIESFGVDPTYQAPAERVIKPVACFYILVRAPDDVPDSDCYRAVYLMERTVRDLIYNIAMKCDIEPSRVVRTLRINSKGFKIILDNEVVREMQEGQDMVVEYSEARSETAIKQEGASPSNAKRSGLELRLYF